MPNLGSGGVSSPSNGRKELFWQAAGWVYARAEIDESSLVVDVGGGQDPHPAANIVVDRFIEEDKHRMGQAGFARELQCVAVNGAEEQRSTKRMTVVQGDLANLPFPSKSVDFIICRHTLEHVPDLTAALAELSRVGKAGYLEVPTFASEMLFPQGDIHCWTFTIEAGKLIAHSIVGWKSPFGRLMHDYFKSDMAIRDAWSRAYYHFHVVLFWRGEITCEIGEEYGAWMLTR